MRGENQRLMNSILELLDCLEAAQTELDQTERVWEKLSTLPTETARELRAAWDAIGFMDEMPGGFLIYRAGGGEEILYANRWLLRLFQCDTMEQLRAFTKNSFRGIVHPEDLEEVEESIKSQIAVSQYDLDYVEYRVIRRDGGIRWIEDYGHYVETSEGGIFYVFLGDATEKRHRQQTEQREQEALLRKQIEEYSQELTLINQEYLRRLEVIEGLSVNYESILYVDLEKDEILPYRLSDRTEETFGHRLQTRCYTQFLAEYVRDWVYPEDRELVARLMAPGYIRERLESSETYYTNYRTVYKGEIQYLQIRLANVGKKERHSQTVLGCRRVDEELRRAMEQKQLLEEALSNANLAIVAKDTFLSNMSHDMRTPLNAISGFTALAKGSLSDAQQAAGYLDRIQASSKQLLELIDETLEMAWADSKEVRLEEREGDLCAEVRQVYEQLKSKALQKNITFVMDFDEVRHHKVCSDWERLKQILRHLTNNAVAYTKPGGQVEIRIREQEQLSGGYGVYHFEVEDTGIGMSPEFQKRLFEPFAREKNTTQSGIHGVGLGLTISRKLIEELGGTIEVASAVGKGSCFTVTLRLRVRAPDAAAERREAAGTEEGQRRLLVVEDNEINLEIEEELLREMGFLIDTATDGSMAVEKVKAAPPGHYHLILMDIQMPVMDGWQAAREIRKLPDGKKAAIPIIALSANVFENDVRTSLESGMNAHLTKPINMEQLMKTIEGLIWKE